MAQQGSGHVTLTVGGMTCGGCAAGVQRILTREPGVRTAQVSFTAGQAVVDYDPMETDPQALAAAVTAAGYQVARLT